MIYVINTDDDEDDNAEVHITSIKNGITSQNSACNSNLIFVVLITIRKHFGWHFHYGRVMFSYK